VSRAVRRCDRGPVSAPTGPAAVFDRAAETYDAVGVPWFGPIAAGLVDALRPQAGERALDVGCGRGAALAPVARRVGPTGRAVGIDLAPAMVRLTAADLADLGWVEVHLDDAAAPSFAPASFDLVSSSLVLFLLDDPVAALRRWSELLVPGGRVGVTTFGEEDPRWRELDAVFLPHLPPTAEDPEASGAADPFDSDAGVEALLADAGFVGVRTVRQAVDATFDDVEHLLRFSWSHGQRATWEAVPPGERHVVRAEIVERAAGLGLGPGPFTLSQDVRHTLGHRPGGAGSRRG